MSEPLIRRFPPQIDNMLPVHGRFSAEAQKRAAPNQGKTLNKAKQAIKGYLRQLDLSQRCDRVYRNLK